MNKPNFRHLYLIIISLFFCSGLQAQKSSVVQPGPRGVYVFLGKKVPCGKIISAYKIERRIGSEEWKALGDVQAPVSLNELISRIETAKKILPAQPLPSRQRLQQLYERAMSSGTIDSLKGFSLYYPIKIGLGLIYYDAGVMTGKEVQYRVTELGVKGESGAIIVSDTISLPHPSVFDEIQFAGSSRSLKTVYLKWYSAGKNPGPLFMVHRIENKKPVLAGGTVGHYSVNDTTYYTFQDSLTLEQSRIELQYMMTPFDLLGNAGKSTQVVAVTHDNFSTSYFMHITSSKLADRTATRINWYYSDPPTLKNVEIYRSDYADRGFVLLASLGSKDTTYVDESIQPTQPYYYFLKAISKSGKRFKESDKFLSLAYHGVIPQSPVITETIGTTKGVSLTIEIKDPNARGVRVFRNDGNSDKLTVITDLILRGDKSQILFIDSSQYLSGRKNYTYAARSESLDNIPSELSNRVTVRPLVVSAPQKPAYFKAFISDKSVKLFWEDMIKADSTIAGYLVSRRTENATAISNLPYSPIAGDLQPFISNMLEDSSVVKGNTYSYTIQSVDKDKTRSLKKAFVTVSFKEEVAIAPIGLSFTSMPSAVKVEWGQVSYKGFQAYHIYRINNGKTAELLSELPASTNEFIDLKVEAGSEYKYFLTTVNQAGKESEHSEVVVISR
ncbi:MAG: hypothetical protein HXX13_13980 [Bacteroidetes bacterium]|nr:hypothetical protein [Bacteroidota bacterium]